MNVTTSTPATVTERGPAAFFKTRMGSFFAVVPLAFWTVNHLWNNLASLRGAHAWEAAVVQHSSPFAEAIGATIALAPLLLHTVWGFSRLFTWRPNAVSYSYYGNIKFILQRLSAVGVLLFLGAHIYLAWIKPHVFEGHGEEFEDIAKEMFTSADGPTLIVYVLGTLGVSYHIGNGLQSWVVGWGLVGSRDAVKRFEWVAIGTFVVLLAMSWGGIFGLYTHGREIVAHEKASASAAASPSAGAPVAGGNAP